MLVRVEDDKQCPAFSINVTVIELFVFCFLTKSGDESDKWNNLFW